VYSYLDSENLTPQVTQHHFGYNHQSDSHSTVAKRIKATQKLQDNVKIPLIDLHFVV